MAPSASVQSAICFLRCRSAFGTLPLKPFVLPLKSFGAPRIVHPFSTSVAKSNAASNQNKKVLSKWRIIARVVYYFRIPFLVLSVYGFGYQQGVIDYSRDPDKLESSVMDTTLSGIGCISPEDKEKVLIAHEGEWKASLGNFRAGQRCRHLRDHGDYHDSPQMTAMLHNISGVGEKIVKTARSYAKGKLADTVKEATSQMPPAVLKDKHQLYQALMESEEVELWTNAQRSMEGQWRFVLIPSDIPNAFVTEMLPRRIFITTSFVELFIESKDELALVLCHEISHLLLGHSSETNSLETNFRTLEILLLSLDPSEGILSLAFMTFLASVRNAMGAVHSRSNERSADELGIKLAAMACFDTRAGSEVFSKMHQQQVQSGKEMFGEEAETAAKLGGLFSFFDSHPPSEERYRALVERSAEENKDKYCRGLAEVFWYAMGA